MTNQSIQSLLNKYVRLKNDISLHIMQKDGLVIKEKDTDEIVRSPYTDKGVSVINKTAMEILLMCTGEYTIEQILKILCKRHGVNIKEYINSIISFVLIAHKKEHIEFYDVRTKREINAKGSYEYISPLHATFEITYKCNLNCKHCYSTATGKYGKELNVEKVLNILEKLSSNGVVIVELTGGEVFLHPNFNQILEFCVNNFMRIAILTNGTMIDEKNSELLSNYKNKVTVSVSLDGSSPKYHDSFRGFDGAFNNTLKGISLLSKVGVKVRVAMSITPENAFDIENTALLAKSLGAKWFSYAPAIPTGRGSKISWDRFGSDNVHKFIEYEKKLYEKYKGFMTFIPKEMAAKMKKENINCGAGWRSICIAPNGNVRPCVIMPENYFVLGNLLIQNYKEVFDNPVVKYLSELTWPNEKICNACSNILFCQFCIFRALLKNEEGKSYCTWIKTFNVDKYFKIANLNKKHDDERCLNFIPPCDQ